MLPRWKSGAFFLEFPLAEKSFTSILGQSLSESVSLQKTCSSFLPLLSQSLPEDCGGGKEQLHWFWGLSLLWAPQPALHAVWKEWREEIGSQSLGRSFADHLAFKFLALLKLVSVGNPCSKSSSGHMRKWIWQEYNDSLLICQQIHPKHLAPWLYT